MKKLMLLAFLVLSIGLFARDYDTNEKRDIIDPIIANSERMNRFSDNELELEITAANINIERYTEFHRDLERSHIGENSER